MVQNGRLHLNSLHREKGCTYLLCNAASFSLLYVRLPDLRIAKRQHYGRPDGVERTLSKSLVLPVSTCPKMQHIGLRRSSLFPAASASSRAFWRRAAASALRCAAIRCTLVWASSEESESESLSSEESSSESSSDSDSSELSSVEGLDFVARGLPLAGEATTAGLAGEVTLRTAFGASGFVCGSLATCKLDKL